MTHLRQGKLFRKTSSLQGRKLDSYSLAVKRQGEVFAYLLNINIMVTYSIYVMQDVYDVLSEEKKVVKSHTYLPIVINLNTPSPYFLHIGLLKMSIIKISW